MLKTLKYLNQHKHYVGKEGVLYEEKQNRIYCG